MTLKLNFGSSRVFWATIGGAGILILLLLVVWVIPAYSDAGDAAAAWQAQLMDLETLQDDAPKIPSNKTLIERREARAFVEKQADWVRSFLADRTKLMEAELAGEGSVDPVDFKNAYVLQIESQRAELAKGQKVPDPAKAYKIYPWVSTQSLPAPSEYKTVLRDYWARYYLYRLFLGKSGGPAVSQVARLEVRDAVPIDHSPDFEGVPFLATVTMDPKSVARLVNTLLTVSPTVTDRPIFQLSGFKLTTAGDAGNQLCALQLEGYILLLKKVEKPAAAAGKSGDMGKAGGTATK